MIAIDTSALIRAFCGARSAIVQLESFVDRGERVGLPTLVLYEWRRGPRSHEELELQELILPSEEAMPFDAPVARLAADLYSALGKPRKRSADIAIAATAIHFGASLWTLNSKDFADIPGLTLVE